jgi:hypothetical protein
MGDPSELLTPTLTVVQSVMNQEDTLNTFSSMQASVNLVSNTMQITSSVNTLDYNQTSLISNIADVALTYATKHDCNLLTQYSENLESVLKNYIKAASSSNLEGLSPASDMVTI